MDIFTSQSILEKEKPFLLNRWFFTGLPVSEVPEGSGILVKYLTEEIIVTKDLNGQLSAMLNSCPHRGTRLIREENKLRNCIICPYHRWTFELNGDLRTAPLCEEDLSDVKIHPVKIDTWNDLIFLSFDPNVCSLKEHLGYLPKEVDDCGIHTFTQVRTTSTVIKSNWKLLQQNFSESYHSIFWHPELEERSAPNATSPIENTIRDRGDFYDSGTIDSLFESMTLSGKKYTGKNKKIIYFSLYPNVLCSLTGDYFFVQRFLPLDVGTTNVQCFFYADPCVDIKDVMDFWKLVFEQDRDICELGQLGNASDYFKQNRWTEFDAEVKGWTDKYEQDMRNLK